MHGNLEEFHDNNTKLLRFITFACGSSEFNLSIANLTIKKKKQTTWWLFKWSEHFVYFKQIDGIYWFIGTSVGIENETVWWTILFNNCFCGPFFNMKMMNTNKCKWMMWRMWIFARFFFSFRLEVTIFWGLKKFIHSDSISTIIFLDSI